FHDSHSTRRRHLHGTPVLAADSPAARRPRPPGNGLALPGRLVPAAHRQLPGLLLPDRAQPLARPPNSTANRPSTPAAPGQPPPPPGPPPAAARRDRLLDLLRDLLGQDRTWTSAQLAEALHPHGIALSGRQVRRCLVQFSGAQRQQPRCDELVRHARRTRPLV